MFKFLVKFGKIMIIACLIGVAFRVIEVTTKKDYNIAQINQNETIAEEVNINDAETEMEDISVSNNIEEKQIENVENKSEEKEEIQTSKSNTEKIQNQAEDNKIEKKTETIKTDNKKEEQKENTKQEVIQNNKETTKKEETKSEESYTEETINVAEKKECIGNNHGMGVGNSGKWFETKEDAISYYTNLIDYWDEWWQKADPNDTEADETYYKNCPDGYEIWSCPYCNKWTINLYY